MERVPVISEIADVIDSRKGGDPKVSYVAKLFSKAPDAAIRPEEVLQELARREGTSGLVEKANRKES